MSEEAAWFGSRTWSPAEASASLPLVRRIADDLLAAFRRWQEAVEAFEYATAGSSADAPGAEAERLMGEAQKLAAEVDGYERELGKLDIRVAQVSHGLLAFRSKLDGEIVPLYWSPETGAPDYDWPESVPVNGTSISWPSRAHDVAAKRSRA